ncbi:hypothetical protein PPL_04400 [Heterostelium album PN500]|uniref:Uncharacterized protein n=1 Tax=Heterostelium pallidum (strain ATCC 26659 / Pp 5 / PN500) TaxID=670386 RepID=D3B7G2_HETP5|nr:hypothetical protein PPL_04400 [Heterostelium album PN500]EFA82705.1 hypothetical protein PPL_04400 [Heterostelium album PN500]|eukprot:XP_020434822.1 hypothetical protein PPL_04400 [Heterostelium album PN500]
MDDNILDIFVGNEEISGTILEKFKDQPDNMVRVALVTLVNSYTKMLTIRLNRDVAYSIYSGYKDGFPHSGGINYSSVSFPIDPTKPNVLFSFWKAKDLGLLERITDRNYPTSQIFEKLIESFITLINMSVSVFFDLSGIQASGFKNSNKC